VASYPRCSIASEKDPLQSCWPSRDRVLVIDQVLYPMGACEPLLSPFGSSNLAFSLEYDLIVGETSSPSICVSLSPCFLDVEFPSDEAILEYMTMDVTYPLPKSNFSGLLPDQNP
jgi:hypothetical protein